MTTSSIADEYAFHPPTRNETFEENGFGPFVVQRAALIEEILTKANPKNSIHISGCRGCGKTTMLDQIGVGLVSKGKTVYYFNNAGEFSRDCAINFVRGLIRSGTEAYILVDETQKNAVAGLFTDLLKNRYSHRITTIGAGIPHFPSVSDHFNHSITVDRLLLTSDQLESEGVTKYFTEKYTTGIDEIKKLLEDIRHHVGGHVYPLMWLAEQLVPEINKEMVDEKAKEVMNYFHSSSFQQREDFKKMVRRILPDLGDADLRLLYCKAPKRSKLLKLKKKGICNNEGKILSHLLFSSILLAQDYPVGFPGELSAGLDGIRQLFTYALPLISWGDYDGHGGPVENALTFEMCFYFSHLRNLGILSELVLEPKLVDNFVAAGTPARRPDIYLNTKVDCYVECVSTTGETTNSEMAKLDEHIARFLWQKDRRVPPPHYQIGKSNFAILNFQKTGTQPLEPSDAGLKDDFTERVFTFLMATKEVYLGSNLIARGTR